MSWLKSVVNRRQRNRQSRRDYNVGTPCDELCTQVIEIVAESCLHNGLVRLLSEHDQIFVYTVPINLLNLLD